MKKTILIYLILCTFFFIDIEAFEISDKNIIVLENRDQITKTAANELAKYLKKITKNDINILTHIPKNSQAIILTKTKNSTINDSFVIRTANDHLIISGSNDRALLYGVYHFLEQYLGCKFLSKDFEYIPHYSHKLLKNIQDAQKPRFNYREIFFKESDDIEFSTKCKLNGRTGHRTILDKDHPSFTIFPKFINNHGFITSDVLSDQYACDGQYDYANKAVQNEALKNLSQKLSKQDLMSGEPIVLEHEDRGSFCTRGLKAGELPSKTFLEFMFYISDNLRNKYPDNYFLFQAYLWSQAPPHKLKSLPKNLGVSFAPIEADFSKPLYIGRNKQNFNNLKSWDKVSKRTYIWHYITNFGGYLFPYPNLYALDKDIKSFSKLNSVQDIFLQGSYDTFGGDLADLKVWVFSKLLWNPDQDINLLIEEFCDYYYKEASTDVQRYIQKIHQFINDSNEELLVKTSIDANYLNSKNLNTLDKILSLALNKVEPNSIYEKHVKALFAGIDYIRLIRNDAVANTKTIKKRFLKYLKDNPQISSFAEGVKTQNIVELLNINRKNPKPPKEATNLQKNIDWFDFQEYQLELCCAKLIQDNTSSNGISAVMDGEKIDWGFSLPLNNLPKDKWDIYANVKVKYHESNSLLDNAKMAFAYGVYPTHDKGIGLIGQFDDNKYKVVKLATVDLKNSNAQSIWLRPPGNDLVKYFYLDRIFAIKKDLN